MKFRLILLISIILCCLNLDSEAEDIKTKKVFSPYGERIYQISSAGCTVFLSGFGDKSFLLTALMAVKYNKLYVFIPAASALILMGYLSIQMGVIIPNYIPTWCIDIVATFTFIILGIVLILQSNLIDEESLNEKHNIKENNNPEQKQMTPKQKVVTFFQIFAMIFTSELGDKSQVSTIYLSSNFDAMTLFYSVSLAQILLTSIAVLGGRYISSKFSQSTLNKLAGSMFLVYGVFSLMLTYINDYKLISDNVHEYYNKVNGLGEVMPDKKLINKNFLK
jgi:putative Ca2+/H+ antiporter (TMEM165/GDT1 family)